MVKFKYDLLCLLYLTNQWCAVFLAPPICCCWGNLIQYWCLVTVQITLQWKQWWKNTGLWIVTVPYRSLLSSGNVLKGFRFVRECLTWTTGQPQHLQSTTSESFRGFYFETRNWNRTLLWLAGSVMSQQQTFWVLVPWCQLELTNQSVSCSISELNTLFLLCLRFKVFNHDGWLRALCLTASSNRETRAWGGGSENAAECGEGESGAALEAGQLPLNQQYAHEEKWDECR